MLFEVADDPEILKNYVLSLTREVKTPPARP